MNKHEKLSRADFLPGASLIKLAACFIYEALAVVALCFVCVLLFITLIGDASHGPKRYLLQLVLWLAIGVYFVWCWKKTGQTLAMQTWQLKLLDKNHQPLSWPRAMTRYMLSSLSLMVFGLGFLWALLDRERRYLHDRLLGSYIIYAPRNAA